MRHKTPIVRVSYFNWIKEVLYGIQAEKTIQNTLTEAEQQQLDRELKELAVLIYDIYQDKLRKEKNNGISSNI